MSCLLAVRLAGAGKTYIASRVIDSFLSDSSSKRVAYFYCNRAEENRRDPESILNTLVQQLAQTAEDDKLLTPIIDIYKEREKKGQRSSWLSLTESQDVLVQLTDEFPQTTIVCIDALDEIDDTVRIQILLSLKYIMEKSKTAVKIFATARMDTDILWQFKMFPRIELQPEDNVSDTNRFIETTIDTAIDEGRLLHGVVPRELKVEICETLCERSRGMFQLAALHAAFLCEMATQSDVRHSLKAFPKTLTNAYQKIYERIINQPGSAPRLALNAFRWIRSSYEPLCRETLLDAITVELGSGGTGDTFSHYMVQANDILKACQNLVILDERLNVFRFAHVSVYEYLESQLPKADSHAELAKVSLSLLCAAPSMWNDYDLDLKTQEEGYGNRHLLLYSAVFWPYHYSRCEDDCQMLTGLWETLVSGANYQRWIHYHRGCVEFPVSVQDTFWHRTQAQSYADNDLLSLVCIFGFRRKFTTAFESMTVHQPWLGPFSAWFRVQRVIPNFFKSGYRKRNAKGLLLLYPSTFSDLDIARLLLDVGADVLAVNGALQTSLHLALEGRHEAVAQLLIDRGADVSAKDVFNKTPLHIALERGLEAVARLIIDRESDFSAVTDTTGRTPLQLAIAGGYEAVAQLLIDRGADVTIPDIVGTTPLHMALQKGYVTVAGLIIEQGADLSTATPLTLGMMPLHLAMEGGHDELVRLMIDRGSNVSAATLYGLTPLQWALEGGRAALAQLMIDRGADICITYHLKQTPLHLALIGDHGAVAGMLIDRGANISAADLLRVTPLHLASERGHEAIARLIVDRGANVSVATIFGKTPLHLASVGGHAAIVRLLIDCGADVSTSDNSGATALQLALEGGHEAIARLLGDRGAVRGANVGADANG
ncbi:ankyrin repeat-containing domain protein [Tricharina praecox]|uniref:ankyrin repeat-containing domain protein n=1 Tax=Tricharina praecox TaxID=43433 RepID=UPI00221FB59B|nr:ankyrin repeat-containing domain protein [Tricharina praecox]KAI5842272.1 ankyrin repeat-containing domain protein [Tricharina praecox]